MLSRTQSEVLLARLQATHATMVAACTQVGAEILALKSAIDYEFESENDSGLETSEVECPRCHRTNPVPCGMNANGQREYACECGSNFSVSEA